MHEDTIVEKLNASFRLTATQVPEHSGRGYRIHLAAPWSETGLGVKSYHVQLCGVDPITGRDVEEDNICGDLDYSQTKAQTGVLTYHGEYLLRCTAHMTDGRVIAFRDQKISLNWPSNAPYVKYTVSGRGDFRCVKIESNCWKTCGGKIWLTFNGHFQRAAVVPRMGTTVQLYVPASGEVGVEVQDPMIEVRKER